MRVETLDQRMLLAADTTGASMLAMDVNADGAITAVDALNIINGIGRSRLNDSSAESLADRLDANRDGRLSARDVLVVINHIGRHGNTELGLRDVLGQREGRMSETQKENLRNLFTDLNSIRADSDVTVEQISELMTNLASALDDANPPSEESVTQLIENARTALEDGELTPVEVQGLTADIQAVVESAGISSEDAQAVADSLRSVMDSSNVDRSDLETIVGDLKAIFQEFQERDPVVSEAQRENLRELALDVRAIRQESEVVADDFAQLRTSVQTLRAEATAPDPRLFVELLRDVRAASADGELSAEERDGLQSSVDAVLDSAGVSQEARDAVVADVQSLVDASNVNTDDLQMLAEDVRSIRSEFQNNHERSPRGMAQGARMLRGRSLRRF